MSGSSRSAECPCDSQQLHEARRHVGAPDPQPGRLERQRVATRTAADLQHPGTGAERRGEPVEHALHRVRHRGGAGGVRRGAAGVRRDRHRARVVADVVQVVDHVVQVVATEALRGEHRAVAAPPRTLPLVAADPVVRRRHELGGRGQGRRHGSGVLAGVVVGDRGRVLVPVREQRVVVAEHLAQPQVEEHVHVADVAGVLQRRPHVVGRPDPRVHVVQRGEEAGHGVPDQRGQVGGLDPGRVEAAFGAGLAQHPGPVLGVGFDRHAGH